MANVEHSTLTTTNLHENKGVSTATDNTVATAVTGATVWAKLTASNLTGTGNPFGAQLFHARDQVTSGTASQGALTAAAWTQRRLQTTITNEIAGTSLGSNQLTLVAGTYFVVAKAIWANTGATSTTTSKLRIRNVSDGTTLVVGLGETNTWSGAGITVTGSRENSVQGRFTLSGSKLVELQHYTSSSGSAGLAITSGETEVYADIMVWKIT